MLRHACFSVVSLALAPIAQANPGRAPRICLAPASAEMAAGNSAEAARAVGEAFASLLTGPTLTTTPLSAPLASQARQEAQAAGCPYVLFASVRHVRKQGGGGLLGKVAGGALDAAAWHTPVGGSVGASATHMAAGAAAAAMRDIAGSVKVKDEMILEYRLEAGDGSTQLAKTEKRRAQSDGEDLLAPLIQRAAEVVATAVARQ